VNPLIPIIGILTFLIGYYLGKKSTKTSHTIAKREPQQERFSKLENKEPAFIRKAKEQDSDLDK
jgi:hypothetical protein